MPFLSSNSLLVPVIWTNFPNNFVNFTEFNFYPETVN